MHSFISFFLIFFKVLRLDNSAPLDLKYNGFGYNNPGLQGDNIQMTNFPQGRSQWEQICDAKDILFNVAPMWRQKDVIKKSLSFLKWFTKTIKRQFYITEQSKNFFNVK